MSIKDKLFYFLIFLIVCLVIYLIWYTHSEGYKCMVDATKYAQDLIQSNSGIAFQPINISNFTFG